MASVDDRIRRELRALSVPVDGPAAFDRVRRRRRRVRVVRRLRIAAAAGAVLAGVVAGGLGLRAVLDDAERSRFVDPGPERSADPTGTASRPEPLTLCWASSSVADLNGDGLDDRVAVGVPLRDDGTRCRDAEEGSYVARIELATGAEREIILDQRLKDCVSPGQCWVLATPDLNDDGLAEIAIEHTSGASTLNFSLYRFHPGDATTPLHRLEVLPPGDPFDDAFGIEAGVATFAWYGSVTDQHWIACGTEPEDRGNFAVVTALREAEDPGRQHVHTTTFGIFRDGLLVVGTEDETVPDGSLDYPAELCGSPLIGAPERNDRLTS